MCDITLRIRPAQELGTHYAHNDTKTDWCRRIDRIWDWNLRHHSLIQLWLEILSNSHSIHKISENAGSGLEGHDSEGIDFRSIEYWERWNSLTGPPIAMNPSEIREPNVPRNDSPWLRSLIWGVPLAHYSLSLAQSWGNRRQKALSSLCFGLAYLNCSSPWLVIYLSI